MKKVPAKFWIVSTIFSIAMLGLMLLNIFKIIDLSTMVTFLSILILMFFSIKDKISTKVPKSFCLTGISFIVLIFISWIMLKLEIINFAIQGVIIITSMIVSFIIQSKVKNHKQEV